MSAETKNTITAVFPAKEVEARLRAELHRIVANAATMDGAQIPADLPAQAAMSTQIDSLVAVELLMFLDGIVGFELKQNIIRSGGYRSINEAVAQILPAIEREWGKANIKKGKQ